MQTLSFRNAEPAIALIALHWHWHNRFPARHSAEQSLGWREPLAAAFGELDLLHLLPLLTLPSAAWCTVFWTFNVLRLELVRCGVSSWCHRHGKNPWQTCPAKNQILQHGFPCSFHVQTGRLRLRLIIAYQVDQVDTTSHTQSAWLTQPASNFPCWSAKRSGPCATQPSLGSSSWASKSGPCPVKRNTCFCWTLINFVRLFRQNFWTICWASACWLDPRMEKRRLRLQLYKLFALQCTECIWSNLKLLCMLCL